MSAVEWRSAEVSRPRVASASSRREENWGHWMKTWWADSSAKHPKWLCGDTSRKRERRVQAVSSWAERAYSWTVAEKADEARV